MPSCRSILFAALTVALLTVVVGCQPPAPATSPAPPAQAVGAPPAPPPPPGAPTSGAGLVAEPPADEPSPQAKTESGLPADLIAKIDLLIKAHQNYIAQGEKVQSLEDFQQHRDELSRLSQAGSDAYDDVMIGWNKLSAADQAKFETYMDKHVAPVNNVRRGHAERIGRLVM